MASGPVHEDLAHRFNLSLTAPEWTTAQVVERLENARRYSIASVTVRPCDIDLAVRTLSGSSVRPGAAVGFPHGSSSTGVKLYEIRDLLRRGATLIEMVVPLSKLVSREFPYVQTELLQAAELCRKERVLLKVAIASPHLTEEMKIVACRCAERAAVEMVQCASEDVALLRKHLPEEIVIEAAGEIETLPQILDLQSAGCTHVSTQSFAKILDAWKSAAQPSTPNPA